MAGRVRSPTSCACRRRSWPTPRSRRWRSRRSATRASHHGEGRWNGVAILSRVGLDDVVDGLRRRSRRRPRGAARHRDLRRRAVMSVYVPNGRALDHEHYQYKLRWLDRLVGHLDAVADPAGAVALCGDFNIAPTDRDVWDIDRARRRHPRERARAGGAAAAARLGAHRRVPRAVPGRRAALLVVGLPRRQLPQGHRHAHRPRARLGAASASGCSGR